MCYHTSQKKQNRETIKDDFGVDKIDADYIPTYYHVSGFQRPQIMIITEHEPEIIQLATWSIAPPNSEDITGYWKKTGGGCVNTRVESLFESKTPYWKKEAILGNKCVFIIDGMFKVFTASNKNKIPMLVRRPDDGLFGVLGYYTEQGGIITASMLTTDSDDVKGLLDNRLEKAKERLENARETIKALCEPVHPQSTIHFQRFFCGTSENPDDLKNTEQLRTHLYKYTVSLIRSYANIANEMEEAGYTPDEIETIKKEVKFYTNLRDEIEKASGDYIDLKRFEPAMCHLIDSYIRADESEVVSAFDDLSLIQLIVERGEDAFIEALPDGIKKDKEAVAETIENNIAKVINTERPTNPYYFEKMSTILCELILERKRGALDYKEYLAKIIELTKRIVRPNKTTSYPSALDNNAKRALYDNLGQDEMLAIAMDEAIRYHKQADFRGNKLKEKKIKIAIKHILPDGYSVDEIFEIVKNQNEY